MLKRITALSIGILSINTAVALPLASIDHIYFFGDSLTDSGFNDSLQQALPVGKAPTFTTFRGFTWSQYLARDIKGIELPIYPGPIPADTITNNTTCQVPEYCSGLLNGFNYAAAGSKTNSEGMPYSFAPSLHQQVEKFLNTHESGIHDNDIFFIWEGTNDILAQLDGASSLDKMKKIAITAASDLATEVENLSKKGAKRFILLNMLNIGLTPLGSLDPSEGAREKFIMQMGEVAFAFNDTLKQKSVTLQSKYSIKIKIIDASNILNTMSENKTDPACGENTSFFCTVDSNQHVFADLVHPTDFAHRLLSLKVIEEIKMW